MDKKTRALVHASIIGALYAVLTHLQNIILPGSASWAIQVRLSEALCVLAFFTPAAIPGLTVGCLVFNILFAAAMPLDLVVGTFASLLATASMWALRNVTIRGVPVLGFLMPALFNGILVGWELTFYFGGGFWINCLYVAAGELIALVIFGGFLFHVLKNRRLSSRLFG